MNVFIGADHRGFELKEELKRHLSSSGYTVVDCGNTSYDSDDDYPEFSFSVGQAVAEDTSALGIIVCGSGVGVTVAANKVAGVRAAIALNNDQVKHAREKDAINVLALSADYLSVEEALKYALLFLETPYLAQERSERRLKSISTYESKTK